MSSSYAVLGATGNCGSAILQHLIKQPNTQINAYCRSKSKLFNTVPSASSNQQLNVHEGSLTDTNLLTECLKGTRAAFLCVAVSGNTPGCTIAQDTASSVLAALERIRAKDANASLPRLVVLSSCEATKTPEGFLDHFLLTALDGIYSDLRAAEAVLRRQSTLTHVTFTKPGLLTDGPPRGHRVGSVSDSVGSKPLPFADLAAAMIEVADGKGAATGADEVGVVALNGGGRFPVENIWLLLKGLVIQFLPWTYPWLKQ